MSISFFKGKCQEKTIEILVQEYLCQFLWHLKNINYRNKIAKHQAITDIALQILRVFWFFATFLFIGLASRVALSLWDVFSSKPIKISVETTNYPLAEFPFPAVTICPKNQINVTIATEYLLGYINGPIKLKYKVLKHILAALYLLKHPNYFLMKGHLKLSRKYLKKFDSLNITDFMLSVLPKCNDLLDKCFWQGRKLNCCEIFTLQRTEEGFCYSFNSLTSDNNKICSFNPLDQGNSLNVQEQNCTPRFLTFSGIYSGLTVFAKYQQDGNKFFLPNRKHVSGILVFVNAAYDFPKAGSGTLLRTLPDEGLQIEVSPFMEQSTRKISRISKDERKCSFDSESGLFTKYYGQHNCFIACRKEFLMRMCGCQLYFFYEPEISSGPLCKVSQLLCIVKYADALKLKSPSKYAFNKPLIKDFPDCHCQPACVTAWYDLVIRRKNISELLGRNITGNLNIFYSKYGARKYKRRLTFSSENLIVSLGGVANLFLGASFISVIEVIYYFSRGMSKIIYSQIVKPAESRIDRSSFLSPHEFIN